MMRRLILGFALAGTAALAYADSASSHRAHSRAGHFHRGNYPSSGAAIRAPSSGAYLPGYYPGAYAAYPDTAVATGPPAPGRRLIGVPPLVDPAAGVIDRNAWSWRPMNLGVGRALPAYATDIRVIESPAVALDGVTFLADDVPYTLRGVAPPPPGTAGAEIARRRLDALLASGERIVVYPVGPDHDHRMVADAVLGSNDLTALLRGM